MRYTSNWHDYELIDCSAGKRLERWGKIILIRPDPQIIWNTPKIDERWTCPDAIYHRSNTGGGRWEIKNKNIKGEKNMKIRLNENEKVVKMVKEGLKKKNGYCPCRLEMNEDTKCMCKEFREQIADENFEGYCHCMLYYKEK